MARKPVVFNNIIKSDCINVGNFVGKETVQMVYIDPPYLTGKDFYKSDGAFAYSDKFSDIHAYISFMSQRIYRIRECLKASGSIWVHIDRRVLYNLKLEMDDIFGEDNFLGDIIWNGGNGMRGTGKFPHTHQTILVYAKDKSKVTLNLPREPISDMAAAVYYKYEDEKGRYCLRDSNGKQYKYYLDSGKRMGSVWNDIPASLGGGVMKKLENTDYPTQKPLALLDRLINFASDKGDLVMDCFCGSGTTGHSAYNNGRVYTLFDVGSLAIETCKVRLSHTPFNFIEA